MDIYELGSKIPSNHPTQPMYYTFRDDKYVAPQAMKLASEFSFSKQSGGGIQTDEAAARATRTCLFETLEYSSHKSTITFPAVRFLQRKEDLLTIVASLGENFLKYLAFNILKFKRLCGY